MNSLSQNDAVVKTFSENNLNSDKNTYSVDENTRFSLAGENSQLVRNFENEVDNIMTDDDTTAKQKAENRTAVLISENTPDVILNNVPEAENLPIVINYTKLYLAARKNGAIKGNYHKLSTEIVKSLPEIIKNPQAIVQLDNGRLNLLSQMKGSKGDNGIISVELNSVKDIEGKYKKYNIVVTMFSANDNYVNNLINKDGATAKYIKEDLSQVNPQLYNRLAIINDKPSNDLSIPQNNTAVNSNNMQNSEENIQQNDENNTRLSAVRKKTDVDDFTAAELLQIVSDEFGMQKALVKAAKRNYGEVKSLLKQNESLKESIDTVRNEMRRSKSPKVNLMEVSQNLKELLNDFGSKTPLKDIGEKTAGIYNQYLTEMKNAHGIEELESDINQRFITELQDVAEEIVNGAEIEVPNEDFAALKAYLQNTEIIWLVRFHPI